MPPKTEEPQAVPDRVGSLDALLWKLEAAIGMADAMSIVVTIDCARRLYERVQMDESDGTACLSDRVPVLQLQDQLNLFDFDLTDEMESEYEAFRRRTDPPPWGEGRDA